MKKPIAYILLILAVTVFSTLAGFTSQQVLSTSIFFGFIFGTLLFWEFRLAFALTGISLLFASGMLDVGHFVEFASLDVILFLVGMMILIGYLDEKNFFQIALTKALPYINQSATKLMIALMIFSFIAAAFVDEVTSILFMAAITLRIAKFYQVNPIPLLIMVVFATNIGSGATVVGNPIGVLIALRSGLSFPDFLRWATPMSFVALAITTALSLWIFRRPLAQLQQAITLQQEETAATKEDSKHESIAVPVILFTGTIIGLLTHKAIENALGLDPNVMLIGVSMAAAGIVLFIARDRAKQLVEKSVDWWTLTFFMLLFASAGTLQYVGVTEHIAGGMVAATGGDINTLFLVTTWSIGILTAVMDNVLAVASFIPVVGDLADAGVQVVPLWWGMLLGGTIMGNLTVIGSTANIVAVGILEREEGKGISFMDWFWPGLVTAVPSMIIVTILLYLQIPLML